MKLILKNIINIKEKAHCYKTMSLEERIGNYWAYLTCVAACRRFKDSNEHPLEAFDF